MAEQIISPGVFTRENDLSFLPQGVGAIGAAIIGPTVKGPAFVPTVVRSFAEYERKFGSLSSDTFIPQTVREYLKNAGSVTVCRVLAGGGYTYTSGTNEFLAVAVSGSSGNVLVGAIFPSKDTSTPDLGNSTISNNTASTFSSDFNLDLSGSGATISRITASLNPTNNNYLFKEIGDNPNNSKTSVIAYDGTPGYGYLNFKNLQSNIVGSGTKEVSTITFADSNFNTSSIESTAAFGNAIVLSNSDDNRVTLVFLTDHYAIPTGTALTGSRIDIDIRSLDTGGEISGSVLADAMNTKINTLSGFSSSLGVRTITVTSTEVGGTIDVERQFNLATASVNVSTQGTDLSGYNGVHSDREVTLITQNGTTPLAFTGLGQTEGYSYASTPFIKSQKINNKELFRFHSLGHGTACNKDYKISIANLREPSDIDGEEQYSTFSVLIRAYGDKDKNLPIILEQYNNCNLDSRFSKLYFKSNWRQIPTI